MQSETMKYLFSVIAEIQYGRHPWAKGMKVKIQTS